MLASHISTLNPFPRAPSSKPSLSNFIEPLNLIAWHEYMICLINLCSYFDFMPISTDDINIPSLDDFPSISPKIAFLSKDQLFMART